MKRRPIFTLILFFLLTACTSPSSGPEKAVEDYLTAIVNADMERISTLSCADWEEDAMLELDSFQGVKVELVGMQCSPTGKDGDTSLVTCSGHFLTSYDGEDTEIDLAERQYELIKQSGEWLVCGYR